jgi:predicted small integral membrane protein
VEAPVRRGLFASGVAPRPLHPVGHGIRFVVARLKPDLDAIPASGRQQAAGRKAMRIIRLSKTGAVAAIAFFASLTAFGNITDYGTNWAFVQHVLSMDTVFATSMIKYRAIGNPTLQTAAYWLIIAAEMLTAILCWIGAARLLKTSGDAAAFDRAKGFAVAGLTLGFLLWQVGFMSIGGEWFGMWMSEHWNGVPDAFRFFVTILIVLVYVVLPDRTGEA